MPSIRVSLPVLVLVLLCCAPAAKAAGGSAAAGARLTERRSVSAVERSIRGCVHSQREWAGLPPLRADAALNQAARRHARNMARFGFFDHDDPWGRGPAERVALYTDVFADFVGENIAAGDRTAAAACRSWMASPGHRENILYDEYTAVGAGFARGGLYGYYYVQDFGG
jgi:uncharacterized protein YkwD